MVMKKSLKSLILTALLFLLPFNLISEPQFDLSLNVLGMMLTGESIAKMGYSWSDKWYLKNVPLIPLAMPAIAARVHKKSNREQQNKELLSTNYAWTSSLNFLGIESGVEYSVFITPLLELKSFAGMKTAWNYGSSQKGLAVYDPLEKKYVKKTSLSELSYMFGEDIAVTAPLPKGNILKGGFNTAYVGFTGAEDKEVWKCGMESNFVNGWKYTATLMLAHMYNNPSHAMVGIIGSASGWYTENYFDDVYKPYNPDFVTFAVTPMAQWVIGKKQNIMINAVISRDRKFKNSDYDSSEELLQEYDGTEWKLKTIMFIWHIPLK